MEMKSKSTVSLEELNRWLDNNQERLIAISKREQKWLSINNQGTYLVYHKNKLVHQGIQSFPALEEYNKIGKENRKVKGILTGSNSPIWIYDDAVGDSELFPISYEFRGFRGYKGLRFSAKKNEVKYI